MFDRHTFLQEWRTVLKLCVHSWRRVSHDEKPRAPFEIALNLKVISPLVALVMTDEFTSTILLGEILFHFIDSKNIIVHPALI
jgi:hypothetical protein